jgi:DNA-binding protein Fis
MVRIADFEKIDDIFLTVKTGAIYREVIEAAEKILIEKALEKTSGNQLTASKLLGLNRNTMRTKIRKLNIDTNQFKT